MPRTQKTSNTCKRKSPPVSYTKKAKKQKSPPASPPQTKKGGKKNKKKTRPVSPVSPIPSCSQTPHLSQKKKAKAKKTKRTPPSRSVSPPHLEDEVREVHRSPQPSTSGAHLSPTSAQQQKKSATGLGVLPRQRARSSSASSTSSSSSEGIVHQRGSTKKLRRVFSESEDEDFLGSDVESGAETPDEHEVNIPPEVAVDNTVVRNDQDVPPELASTDDEFVGFQNVPDFQTPPRNRDGDGGAYVYGGRNLEHINSHWQKRSRPQMKLPFTGKTGFREYLDLPAKEEATPKDFFDLFMKDEDYETMALQTNL